MCGTPGNWKWGFNSGAHWADDCSCTGNAPHSFNAAGVCICGATGTPGTGGGGAAGPASPCGICGVVGPWYWGGNADVHWAANCNCTGNEPHSFDASGRCRCGATGAPGAAAGMERSACPMCGVVGSWSWGFNDNVHWANNCNCTANEPHTFVFGGLCRCGASPPGGPIAAPQENFRDEDFIDAGAIIDDLLRAIAAGETPTIDLTTAGSVTIINADVFQAIADAGVDVEVILPSGFKFTIIASSITANVGAFDLHIEVIIKYALAQLETIGGGKVDVPANSIVFRPNFHGEFGFELVFTVTAEQVADAGLDLATVRLYHVDAGGNVTDKGSPTLHDDGSISFSKTHASFYVLSSNPPVTTEVGTTDIGSNVTVDTPAVSDQPSTRVAPTQLERAAQADSIVWILVAIVGAAVIAAGAVAVVMIKRKKAQHG